MLTSVLRAVGALLLFVPRLRALLPALLWIGLIGWLGSWSSTGVGDLGRTAFLTNLGHAPLYGILALWLALALPRGRPPGPDLAGAGAATRGFHGALGVGAWPRIRGAGRWWVLGAVAVVGVADEVHQKLGDRGRDFSLFDVLTDLVGAACVLAVVAYLGRDEASDRGLAGRLALGLAACGAAAALATWAPLWFPGVSWL